VITITITSINQTYIHAQLLNINMYTTVKTIAEMPTVNT